MALANAGVTEYNALQEYYGRLKNEDSEAIMQMVLKLLPQEDYRQFIVKLEEGFDYHEAFKHLTDHQHLPAETKYVNFKARFDYQLEKVMERVRGVKVKSWSK
jgi:hypothetical protein